MMKRVKRRMCVVDTTPNVIATSGVNWKFEDSRGSSVEVEIIIFGTGFRGKSDNS